MNFYDLALTLIAFFSEVLGTISGFGSSTFFVPTAIFFESFNLVLILTALLHCFSNLSKIAIFKKSQIPRLLWLLAIPSVLLTGLGAVLSNILPQNTLEKYLGVVLMIIPLVLIFGKNKIQKTSLPFGMFLSGLSGFTTGLIGTGGALRGLILTTMRIEKESFLLISAGMDFGGDLLRALIYLKNGYMDWQQWFYIPLLGLAAFAGAKVGKLVLNHMNQEQFEKIVAIFIFFSGLTMVFF